MITTQKNRSSSLGVMSYAAELSSEELPPGGGLIDGSIASAINNSHNSRVHSISPIPEWKKQLRNGLTKPEDIAKKFNLNPEEVEQVTTQYPAMINSYYLSLIKNKDDPLYKQSVPDYREITDTTGFVDPLNEDSNGKVPTLITHRYPDRALFRVSNQCAMYCRFCTRKRKVGDDNKNPTLKEIEKGLEYLAKTPQIRDVIISGGDPLMLDDKKLETILDSVYSILKTRENFTMRIGTRIPVVLPHRITDNLVSILSKYEPLYINTHFNHPNEITAQSSEACRKLRRGAGAILGNQTVLLKGVNDDPLVMKELMQGLVHIGVKPYYIYQADPVIGTNHLRTKVEKGIEIISALRGHTSGLCVPHFVIDAPNGGGKIPILPEYLQSIDGDKVVLKNYLGNTHEYPQIQE